MSISKLFSTTSNNIFSKMTVYIICCINVCVQSSQALSFKYISSGPSVFHCDIIFHIPFVVDLQALQRYRLLCTTIYAVIFMAVGILIMKLETLYNSLQTGLICIDIHFWSIFHDMYSNQLSCCFPTFLHQTGMHHALPKFSLLCLVLLLLRLDVGTYKPKLI